MKALVPDALLDSAACACAFHAKTTQIILFGFQLTLASCSCLRNARSRTHIILILHFVFKHLYVLRRHDCCISFRS